MSTGSRSGLWTRATGRRSPTEVPSWEGWHASRLDSCRLVVELDGVVVGWAALSAVSNRPVYRGVAEHSIYVAPSARNQRVGNLLLGALIEASEQAGMWTLQTAIFPENRASIALHEHHDFRVVGTRTRLGQHHGRWRDVVLLERRSSRVGG